MPATEKELCHVDAFEGQNAVRAWNFACGGLDDPLLLAKLLGGGPLETVPAMCEVGVRDRMRKQRIKVRGRRRLLL